MRVSLSYVSGYYIWSSNKSESAGERSTNDLTLNVVASTEELLPLWFRQKWQNEREKKLLLHFNS